LLASNERIKDSQGLEGNKLNFSVQNLVNQKPADADITDLPLIGQQTVDDQSVEMALAINDANLLPSFESHWQLHQADYATDLFDSPPFILWV
jgi:hypothetical protein